MQMSLEMSSLCCFTVHWSLVLLGYIAVLLSFYFSCCHTKERKDTVEYCYFNTVALTLEEKNCTSPLKGRCQKSSKEL